MSPETIRVEQLENGIRAAFVNMSHFRTHSARLTVSAGSLHEAPNAYGAAHFLEHVTFQGTDAMPTQADVHRYAEEKGLVYNASTGQAFTNYKADGYELESVGFFVSQVALKPTLSSESLERERKPIIDEIRGYASSPFYEPIIAHDRATRGELYARRIAGNPEDIQHMSDEALRNFHQRHYRLGNAVLVICSAEPVETQREFAETLLAGYEEKSATQPQQIELREFNPDNLIASLEVVGLPLSAQTSISIRYALPEIESPEEHLGYNLVSMILSEVAHNRLRRELALCYGAGAGTSRLSDLNFGRNKNWAHFTASVNLNGEDSIVGLNALRKDVLHKPLPESVFQSILVGLHRNFDHIMQSDPSQVADRVRDILSITKRDEIALDEVEAFATRISLKTLHKLQKDMTDTNPLVLATSPDRKVLENIGEWANSNI